MHGKTTIKVNVDWLLLSDFNETWILLTFSKKHSNIKFHENPSSGSRVVPCGRTDGYDEDNSGISQFCEILVRPSQRVTEVCTRLVPFVWTLLPGGRRQSYTVVLVTRSWPSAWIIHRPKCFATTVHADRLRARQRNWQPFFFSPFRCKRATEGTVSSLRYFKHCATFLSSHLRRVRESLALLPTYFIRFVSDILRAIYIHCFLTGWHWRDM